MADNVFRDIGTAITKPIGELFGGAVTALQPGRVQQMQFERQQQELKNHFDMFNRFMAMGDKPSAYQYMTDTILPFVKASPELRGSVKQFQMPESTDSLDLAKQYSGLRKALPRDELGEKVHPQAQDQWDYLLGKETEQYKRGGFRRPQPELTFKGYGKEREPTTEDLKTYKRMGLEEYTSPSGKQYKTGGIRPQTEQFISPKGIKPSALDLQGMLPAGRPMTEEDLLIGEDLDVFEQLMPKKTVKQLQKEKSRDPNLLELSQIFATAKVPRTEIYKEAAKLKSIWSELNLQEKLDVYELLAQGKSAKEIIEYYKAQENEQ